MLEIFYEDNRVTELGFLDSFFFILRRIVFVLTILFLVEDSLYLITFLIFMLSSLLNISYWAMAHPLLSKNANRIEIINEFFVLLSSYFAMMLINDSRGREELLSVGLCLKSTIIICVLANFFILLVIFISQLRRMV